MDADEGFEDLGNGIWINRETKTIRLSNDEAAVTSQDLDAVFRHLAAIWEEEEDD